MPTPAFSTDLYQLTMIAGYFRQEMLPIRATFELFVRRLPPNRAFLVAAGLDQALGYLEDLTFSGDDVDWLRHQPSFRRVPQAFFDYLSGFRFSGDVWAMREGTPFFPMEPVLRVSAPIAEAQLVETALLAIVNFQTTIASKTVRIVYAGGGRPVMEFGARRAHGLGAALFAARAAYLAGCVGTSFVEAGRTFGIPVSGTMAHSWILAAASEADAFIAYAELFDPHTVLLLDTFDVNAATKILIESGLRPQGVRIDSGDLAAASRSVRELLDGAGLSSTRIIVSGDLDEWKIADLVASGAPVDTFAVGTALATSDDAPALGGVYKLVELTDRGVVRKVMKRSEGKGTWPGAKQVWRSAQDGVAIGDLISLGDEGAPPSSAKALLEPVMRDGRRVTPQPSLEQARQHCRHETGELPSRLRSLSAEVGYPVERSAALATLAP
jgi:nicotinate phosphoribosyltransferase